MRIDDGVYVRICTVYSKVLKQHTQHAFFYVLTGSPYRDAEVSSQLRSCLHDAIINAYHRIGGGIDQLELYRQFSPIRLKDKEIEEL